MVVSRNLERNDDNPPARLATSLYTGPGPATVDASPARPALVAAAPPLLTHGWEERWKLARAATVTDCSLASLFDVPWRSQSGRFSIHDYLMSYRTLFKKDNEISDWQRRFEAS